MYPVLVANRLINLDYCIRAVIGPDEPESVPEGEVRAVMYPGVTLTFRGEDASLLRRYLEALAVGAPHGGVVPPDAGPGVGHGRDPRGRTRHGRAGLTGGPHEGAEATALGAAQTSAVGSGSGSGEAPGPDQRASGIAVSVK